MNFNLKEFACKDGTAVPIELLPNLELLISQLEIIRTELNQQKPNSNLIIISGYRTTEHNKKVGGKPNSMHLQAKASDLKSNNFTARELFKIIKKLIEENQIIEGGLALYPTFVHYDVRGTKARWN